MMSKGGKMSNFKFLSWQGLVIVLFLWSLIVWMARFLYWSYHKEFLLLISYSMLALAILTCVLMIFCKQEDILALFRQLEENMATNEEERMRFLVKSLCKAVLLDVVTRVLAAFVIMSSEDNFNAFADTYWFGFASILPGWLFYKLVFYDLLISFLIFYAPSLLVLFTLPLVLCHVVLKYRRLNQEVMECLANDRFISTTRTITRFRHNYCKMGNVMQCMEGIVSIPLGVLSFAVGVGASGILFFMVQQKVLGVSTTDPILNESLPAVILLSSMLCFTAVLLYDDRSLLPITSIRTLCLRNSLYDVEFALQSEGLVQQLLNKPCFTVAKFFPINREALVHVFGAIGTYFMMQMNFHPEIKKLIVGSDYIFNPDL